MWIKAKSPSNTPDAVAEDTSPTSFMTVILTLTRTSGAGPDVSSAHPSSPSLFPLLPQQKFRSASGSVAGRWRLSHVRAWVTSSAATIHTRSRPAWTAPTMCTYAVPSQHLSCVHTRIPCVCVCESMCLCMFVCICIYGVCCPDLTGVSYSLARNTARTAEVWMDDYKKFYYESRPAAVNMFVAPASACLEPDSKGCPNPRLRSRRNQLNRLPNRNLTQFLTSPALTGSPVFRMRTIPLVPVKVKSHSHSSYVSVLKARVRGRRGGRGGEVRS